MEQLSWFGSLQLPLQLHQQRLEKTSLDQSIEFLRVHRRERSSSQLLNRSTQLLNGITSLHDVVELDATQLFDVLGLEAFTKGDDGLLKSVSLRLGDHKKDVTGRVIKMRLQLIELVIRCPTGNLRPLTESLSHGIALPTAQNRRPQHASFLQRTAVVLGVAARQ